MKQFNFLKTNFEIKHLQSGVTLMELMIAVGITSIVVAQSYNLFLNSKEVENAAVVQTKTIEQLSLIKSRLNDSKFIKLVATKNTAYANCRANIASCPKAGNQYQKISISLFSRKGSQDIKIAGPQNAPVYYKSSGELSSAANGHHRLYAYAQPFCGENCTTGKPPTAIAIHVVLEVKDASGWMIRNNIMAIDEVSGNVRKIAGQVDCGIAENPYKKFSRGVDNGTLDCSWAESPATRPDMKGLKGDDGDNKTGPQGPAGRSVCHYKKPSGVNHVFFSTASAAQACCTPTCKP